MFQRLQSLFGFGAKPPEAKPNPPPLPPRPGPPPLPGNKPHQYPRAPAGSALPSMHQPGSAAMDQLIPPATEFYNSIMGSVPGQQPAEIHGYNTPEWSGFWNHPGNVPLFAQNPAPGPMPPPFHPYSYFPPQPATVYVPGNGIQPPMIPALPPSWPHIPNVNPRMPSAVTPAPLSIPVLATSHPENTDAPLYQWPNGDVKLECTYGQEPVGWDDQGWKWRSSGSRRKGVPESATNVDKRLCLGVFRCGCTDNTGAPSRFFRPKSATKARNRQHTETCDICRTNLVHIPILDDEQNPKVVRHHLGRHDHPRPPLTKLSASEAEALDLQVRQNPQATAQQLRVGAGATQLPLGAINPILSNPRKARHEVEQSKVRQDIIPAATRNSGFQLLESFSALKNSFAIPWIVEAELLGRQYICMQTPFMRDVLLRDSVQSWHAENLEAESGRHGVITDGTHNFFKQGILLTSLVFSPILFRWVVVLYTWIGSQDQEHHIPHFKQLVQVIAEICTRGLGFDFDDRLFSAILDFSNAQRNGFIEAFVNYMCSRIPGWNELSVKSQKSERATLRSRAQTLLIGCKVHWRRSTHKIKQVVGLKFQFRFEGLITILEAESTTPAEFLQAVHDIHREFPEVRPWLSWWILPGNGGMIFPAMQRMSPELRAQLPSSTNGAESAHNLLYRGAGKHHDIWEGVRRLYCVQRETEMLYDAVLVLSHVAGHVHARFQGAKPQPMSRISHTWYENDGRAPDTRERLAAVEKLEADLIAQKSSLSQAERFVAANLMINSTGEAGSGKQQQPDTRLLQSYKWDANSCYIDAPMEAFFRAFVSMSDAVRTDFLRRIRTECQGTGLQDVFEHFWLRGLHAEKGQYKR
ncbi:hypothetical protein DFH07DRAFT_781036 [Mycena maculata]|uniref:GCM domain-containing protein n=1 Tax=Mycena maculata TaxID=230809 RepID=A0AAD7MTG8_9AGAR|nr:hypothetical protein DFH07DRAFT_781036 [Mycena maculata]